VTEETNENKASVIEWKKVQKKRCEKQEEEGRKKMSEK